MFQIGVLVRLQNGRESPILFVYLAVRLSNVVLKLLVQTYIHFDFYIIPLIMDYKQKM